MPKRSGIVLVIFGAVLILSALLLFLSNEREDHQAGYASALLIDDIRSAIAEKTTAEEQPSATEAADAQTTEETPSSAQMPAVNIDGHDYIGYLSIPELEIELPVMAEWDYNRLEIAPCRHFGSIVTDDLVIAAHNYTSHFGSLSDLKPGAEIMFTNMDGIETHYTLSIEPQTLAPEDVDAVQNSGHDLVLYTCTPGGRSRWAVFCDRTTN